MRRKYNNKKVEYEGIIFDSKLERDRYIFLKDLEDRGCIRNLELQPTFVLMEGFETSQHQEGDKVSKIRPITYKADFSYITQKKIIEDAKGFKTEVYKIKRKMLLNSIKHDSSIQFREIKKATEGIG